LLKISARTTSDAETAMTDLFEVVFGQSPVVESRPDSSLRNIATFVESSEWSSGLTNVLRSGLRRIKDSGLGSSRLSIEQIRREDWAESWKRHFKPIEIGRALLIKPSWSRRPPRAGQAVIVLDPGLSFGTGQHHTTRYCLDHLAALRHIPVTRTLLSARRLGQNQSLLDLGAGSGILAIAAAKLGYSPVRAIDNDPEAVRIARQNARRNRVEGKLTIDCRDLTKDRWNRKMFDVVCANLIADVLIATSQRIAAAVNDGGFLIAAGILHREFGQVAAAFRARGLKVVHSKREGEWRSAVFRKPDV
jgi:ribosomal protein L11 methyltransferase